MRLLLTVCCWSLLTAAAAAAADPPPVPAVLMPLHPAAAPTPGLKYTLLPELRDTTPGNAAEHCRQAVKLMRQDGPPPREWRPDVDRWLLAPLRDVPCDEVRDLLKPFAAALKELDAAARCESCDWGLTERIRRQGIAVAIPDVAETRDLAILLQLRIRLEVAERRYGDAVRSLRTGYATARCVADQPCLICALIGAKIGDLMTDRLEELLRQPGAPNLYWALTDLPRPFIDLRKPLQGERVMVYATFPGMAEAAADPDAGPLTEDQIAAIVQQLRQLDDADPRVRRLNEVKMALRLNARYEADKRRLVAEGRPKERVDAMPQVEVGLLLALEEYDRAFDELLKAENLPPWEALPRIREAVKLREAKDDAAIPGVNLFLPRLDRVFSARVRLDRRLAALRCVEAVRLYAAAHGGKLPKSLGDGTEAPPPSDPLTGKDFAYAATAERAVLSCDPPAGEAPDARNTPTYELLLEH